MAMSETKAHQKTALITGASTGIGKAAALALIKAGYSVVGTSRSAKRDEVRDGIPMVACDVTSDASVAMAVALADSELGHIDLLVNNAGFGVTGAAEESSIAQVQALFETNFHGVVRVTNAVLPIMRAPAEGFRSVGPPTLRRRSVRRCAPARYRPRRSARHDSAVPRRRSRSSCR